MGARDPPVAGALGLRRRALPDQPEVRRGVGAAVPGRGRGAASRGRPRSVRGARARGRADDRRLRGRGGARRDGRLLRVRRGRRGGPCPAGEAPGGRAPQPDPGPRAQRRGVRELRGPGGPVRDDAAARSRGRADLGDLTERDRGLDDEPARVGPRRRPADRPRRGQRGGGGARRHVRVGRGGCAHEARRDLHRDAARRRRHRARARRAACGAQARHRVRAGGALGGRPARDRGAHGGAGGGHDAA